MIELIKKLKYVDGHLVWVDCSSLKNLNGKVAGTICKDGRVMIKSGGKRYLAHRVIYFMHYGTTPELIDHIDGNPSNNKIENLRAASKVENGLNSKMRSSNKSGYKNVSWDKAVSKWRVAITCKKDRKFWYFKDLELADLVAKEARDLHHGEFARHL